MNKLHILIFFTFILLSCSRREKSMRLFGWNKKQKISHSELELKYDLSDSNLDDLIELEIGEINLPTGRIIASDPFFTKDIQPFSRSVNPGKYPVKIYISEVEPNHYRVAFAKIKFKDLLATKWILAVTDDMKLNNYIQRM